MLNFDWKSTSSGKHGAGFLLSFLFASLPLRDGLDTSRQNRLARIAVFGSYSMSRRPPLRLPKRRWFLGWLHTQFSGLSALGRKAARPQAGVKYFLGFCETHLPLHWFSAPAHISNIFFGICLDTHRSVQIISISYFGDVTH